MEPSATMSGAADFLGSMFVFWILAAVFFFIAVPPEEEWLLRVRPRRWYRYITGLATLAVASLSVLFLVASIVPMPFLELSGRAEALASAGMFSGGCALVFLFWKYSDILVSRRGIYANYAFREWRDIGEIEESHSLIWIRMPKRRIAWTGETFLHRGLWELTPEVMSQMEELHRQARRLSETVHGARPGATDSQ